MNDKFVDFVIIFSGFYCETCDAYLLQGEKESYEECAEKGKQAGWCISDKLDLCLCKDCSSKVVAT